MNKKDRSYIIAVFLISLVFSLLCVAAVEYVKIQERRKITEYATSSQVSRLQYILDTLLMKTQTLEMLIVENQGELSDFDVIAGQLYDNPAIRSLQLAPDGVVEDIYPIGGNENGFIDLFSDPDRATEAAAARDSGKMTLSGPFELYQGGFGAVGRRPVYLPQEDGGEAFWGFAIIVLDLPDAFAPAKLDIFQKEGFEYKLYRIHPDTGGIQIIDESSEEELKDPAEVSFEVPNGTWTFSVMPAGGWIRMRDLALENAIALTVTLLLTFIAGFIIKLRRQKEELYQLTIMDNLTGLYNYSSLMKTLAACSRDKKPYSLFFMDLDGFKMVNDTYGHAAGNQVLMESAVRIRECFAADGAVFRNGGDEFCAVKYGDAREKDCMETADKVAEKITEPFLVDGKSIRCGISIGFARYPGDGADVELLIRKADSRMYERKKRKGKADGSGSKGRHGEHTVADALPAEGIRRAAMRVLVFGGTRFFGIHLVESLVEAGHTAAICTRGRTGDSFGASVERLIGERTDSDALKEVLRNREFDVLCDNLAYCSEDVRTALGAVGCGRYVMVSSASVYDLHPDTVEEDFDPVREPLVWCAREEASYDRLKQTAECAAMQVYGERNPVLVRFPYVIGPDDYTDRLYFYVRHAILGIPMNIDNLDSRMSFIDSSEAGSFLAFAAGSRITGPVNACSRGTVTLRELLDYVERTTGKKAMLSADGEAAPYNGTPDYSLNTEKAEAAGYRFTDIRSWIFGLLDEYIRRASGEQ